MSLSATIIIYALLASLATILGLHLVLFKEGWVRRNTIYLISLSAGILLSVTFSHLVPESLELYPNALFYVLISFLFFYILEHAISVHACHEETGCEVHTFSSVAIVAMTLHSILDGIIIGIGFEVSSVMGFLAALSVILHRLPDGISLTSILLHQNFSRERVKLYNYIIAGATFLGAIGSFLLFKNISESLLGVLLALAAGSFLYISSADLIPEIHKKSKILNIVLVLLGVMLPIILGLITS